MTIYACTFQLQGFKVEILKYFQERCYTVTTTVLKLKRKLKKRTEACQVTEHNNLHLTVLICPSFATSLHVMLLQKTVQC